MNKNRCVIKAILASAVINYTDDTQEPEGRQK